MYFFIVQENCTSRIEFNKTNEVLRKVKVRSNKTNISIIDFEACSTENS